MNKLLILVLLSFVASPAFADEQSASEVTAPIFNSADKSVCLIFSEEELTEAMLDPSIKFADVKQECFFREAKVASDDNNG